MKDPRIHDGFNEGTILEFPKGNDVGINEGNDDRSLLGLVYYVMERLTTAIKVSMREKLLGTLKALKDYQMAKHLISQMGDRKGIDDHSIEQDEIVQ